MHLSNQTNTRICGQRTGNCSADHLVFGVLGFPSVLNPWRWCGVGGSILTCCISATAFQRLPGKWGLRYTVWVRGETGSLRGCRERERERDGASVLFYFCAGQLCGESDFGAPRHAGHCPELPCPLSHSPMSAETAPLRCGTYIETSKGWSYSGKRRWGLNCP